MLRRARRRTDATSRENGTVYLYAVYRSPCLAPAEVARVLCAEPPPPHTHTHALLPPPSPSYGDACAPRSGSGFNLHILSSSEAREAPVQPQGRGAAARAGSTVKPLWRHEERAAAQASAQEGGAWSIAHCGWQVRLREAEGVREAVCEARVPQPPPRCPLPAAPLTLHTHPLSHSQSEATPTCRRRL